MFLNRLPEPKSVLRRFAGWLNGVFTSLLFFSTLLACNVLQTASLALVPFSRAAFRKFNRFGANVWWGWCVVWAEKIFGTKIIFTGERVPEGENAIVVANHQQMPDVNVLMSFARRKRRLGDMKWFVKDIVKYVPGPGWGMLFLGCPFLKRDWSADRERINKAFSRILKTRMPVWLITFAEGTRITQQKLMHSQAFAKAKGLVPFKHVLMPRTKGFVASVQGLRNHVDAIYDMTIGYAGGIPSLWQFIKGHVKQVHLHVRRYDIKQMPEEPTQLSEWIIERYREKDQLLAYFHQHGHFPGELLEEAS